MSTFPPEFTRPFTVTRYQREGSRVDIAPRVRSMSIGTIDKPSLFLSHADSGGVLGHTCVEHESCAGHLLTHDETTVLLPSWCISDDPEMMDKRAKATLNVMSGVITNETYAREVRSTLMSKSGLARNKLLGSQPITSMRGVAICLWDTDVHAVKVPSSWMERMKIPYRKSEGEELSPYWSFRPAREGDAAVLIRDPIVSDSSVQPVTISGWKHHGIGVHPEMCVPLNMDYDGDEVHVLVLSWSESVSEVTRSIAESSLRRFAQPPATKRRDFMACSTVSMSQLHLVDYNDEPARISRCKESSRVSMCDRLKQPLSRDYRSYVDQWCDSTSSMASSHLSVSLGYVFSRQLRISAMTLNSTVPDLRPSWSLARGLDVKFNPGLTPGVDFSQGLPGARLALRISGLITQRYLDMAKDQNLSSDDTLLLSLTSGHGTKCHIIATSSGHRLVTELPYDMPLSSVVASTDPDVNRAMKDSARAYRSCVTMVQLACFRTSCPATASEVAGLAALICWSHLVLGHSRISDIFPVPFLSLVGSDLMTSSLCENIGIMDRVGQLSSPNSSEADARLGFFRSQVSGNTETMSYRLPYCALAMGNLSWLMRLSVSNRR